VAIQIPVKFGGNKTGIPGLKTPLLLHVLDCTDICRTCRHSTFPFLLPVFGWRRNGTGRGKRSKLVAAFSAESQLVSSWQKKARQRRPSGPPCAPRGPVAFGPRGGHRSQPAGVMVVPASVVSYRQRSRTLADVADSDDSPVFASRQWTSLPRYTLKNTTA